MTETTGEIAKALSALQAEMPVVPKGQKATVPTKSGGNYTYTYANLADVTEVAYPLLAKHGLAFSCAPRVGGGGEAVIGGVLLHTSGESIEASLPLFGRTAQEIGSALTYARRYLLGCLTGLVTDDDDDGSLAEKAKRTEVPMTDKTRRQMFAEFKRVGVSEDKQLEGINYYTAGGYESRGDVTEADAQRVIGVLKSKPTHVAEDKPEGGEPDA